jgi:hypothetical protein
VRREEEGSEDVGRGGRRKGRGKVGSVGRGREREGGFVLGQGVTIQ